jgi:hypothetical protein
MNPRRRRHNKRARKDRRYWPVRRPGTSVFLIKDFSVFFGGQKMGTCSEGVITYSAKHSLPDSDVV